MKTIDATNTSPKKLWEGSLLFGPSSSLLDENKVAFLAVIGGEQTALITSPGQETTVFLEGASFPDFSPDGQWLAYCGVRSGRREVYVRGYPDNGVEVLISTAGGWAPVWSPDGSEIFYKVEKNNAAAIMAVAIETRDNRIRPGNPRKLFEGSYIGGNTLRAYSVAPDGRFLMLKTPPDSAVTRLREQRTSDRIQIAQNWFAKIESKLSDAK